MDFDDLPRRWLANLNLKLFALNTRPNLLPNLWCICKLSISPNLIASDDQQVSFTICENNTILAFSAVYASTNYQIRRKLWSTLNTLQAQHNFPWCFLGDFNVILEHMNIEADLLQLDYPLKSLSNGQMTSTSFIFPLEVLLSLRAMDEVVQGIQKED
jgi:hypothetical protein